MESTSCSSSYSYVLQLTIQSAETLTTTGKKPVKQKTFVVISAEDDNQAYVKQQQQQQQQRCTGSSEEGGSNPTWNAKLEITIPMHTNYITLDVRCATSSRSQEKSHSIGVARVPISDFIGNCYNNSNDYLHFLSYRLRDRVGEPNGIVNFSVKVLKGLDTMQQPTRPYVYKYNGFGEIGGWSEHHKKENYGYGSSSTHVVGVNGWRNPNTVVVGVPAHMAW